MLNHKHWLIIGMSTLALLIGSATTLNNVSAHRVHRNHMVRIVKHHKRAKNRKSRKRVNKRNKRVIRKHTAKRSKHNNKRIAKSNSHFSKAYLDAIGKPSDINNPNYDFKDKIRGYNLFQKEFKRHQNNPVYRKGVVAGSFALYIDSELRGYEFGTAGEDGDPRSPSQYASQMTKVNHKYLQMVKPHHMYENKTFVKGFQDGFRYQDFIFNEDGGKDGYESSENIEIDPTDDMDSIKSYSYYYHQAKHIRNMGEDY